jgi:hypothetical protein
MVEQVLEFLQNTCPMPEASGSRLLTPECLSFKPQLFCLFSDIGPCRSFFSLFFIGRY